MLKLKIIYAEFFNKYAESSNIQQKPLQSELLTFWFGEQ